MRRILAVGLVAALAAGSPAAAENNGYNPFDAARSAINKARAARGAMEARSAETQAEIEGKNDAPGADSSADQGGGNLGAGPRATARNVLAVNGVDTSQALTPDQKRTVQEKMGEWRGEKNDVATSMARNANHLKSLETQLQNMDPKTEYQMDDDGQALEVAGNPDYVRVQGEIEQIKSRQGELTRRFENLSGMEQFGQEIIGPGGPGAGGESTGGTVLTTGAGTTGGPGGGTSGGGIVCPTGGPVP